MISAVITKKRVPFVKGTFPPLSSRQVTPSPRLVPPWVFACVTSGNTREFWWDFPIPPVGVRMGGNAFIFRFVFLNEISLEPYFRITNRFHI